MKVISIVGRKNSGKTSLTVKVIEALKKRDYTVATIKHSHHNLEMDRENTDTWRHKQAGSEIVAGLGATTYFNIRDCLDLDRILFLIKAISDVDFVVIEGFKSYNYAKIATTSDVVDEYTIKQVDSFKITPEEVEDLIDLAEKKAYDIPDTLYYDNCGYNDGDSIAREIVKGNIKLDDLDKVDVSLSINDTNIGLNKFVNNFLKKTVLSMIKTLNTEQYGVNEVERVELLINNQNFDDVKKFDYEDDKITLLVNKKEIEINDFVSKYLKDTIFGMLGALDTEEYGVNVLKTAIINIKNIDINNMNKAAINIKVNDKKIAINDFVSGILKESIFGMIKALKIEKFDIDKIESIDIAIK